MTLYIILTAILIIFIIYHIIKTIDNNEYIEALKYENYSLKVEKKNYIQQYNKEKLQIIVNNYESIIERLKYERAALRSRIEKYYELENKK